MPTDCISYQDSGYFSKIIIDYLNEKKELQSFYHNFPKIENFKSQIDEKSLNFDSKQRDVLVKSLKNQYSNFEISKITENNINLLDESNTFTITTGHQLNLFTGPLYFLYKIVSTINLCKQLKKEYPDNNFVPLYWMATEDHDFEEINHFNFKGKKFSWNAVSKGPVGRLSTDGLHAFLEVFETELDSSSNANYLKQLFSKSYLKHQNLADATRFLVNTLFGKYGLVILDGDSVDLKKQFIPFVVDELVHQNSYIKVQESISLLKEYPIQVNPREINLFYIENSIRERITLENGIYKINNTKIEFSKVEILTLVHSNPEKFSPNVILRPLYQEVILPNLCYIGGGGEIAYWLELKAMFVNFKVTFPMLLLRNSVVLYSEKQKTKMEKLDLSWKQLFLKQENLINIKTEEFSNLKLDFSEQKKHLKKQFEDLKEMATKSDKSFLGAVNAQKAKQIKGLENLEKKLLRAEKKIYKDKLERIYNLQNEIFPYRTLQERKCNFSGFYLQSGNTMIEKLIENLNPLVQEFNTIIL